MIGIETDKFNTYGCDDVKCPYCGWEDGDSWEYRAEDGDEIKVECGECQREFTVYVTISRTFTSNCADNEHELVTNGKYQDVGRDKRRYYQCRNCEFSNWMTEDQVKDIKKVDVIKEEDIPFE